MEQNKAVIITGASQGIGAGLVRAFSARGARVVANSRSIVADAFPGVVSVRGDIADPDTSDRLVQTALDRFGRVDTIVNNAEAFLSKPFTDYSGAEFAATIGVHLHGFFNLSRRAAAVMLDGDGGHIVTITTSLVEQPMLAVPSALAALTKGGLDAVTRSLSIEYATRGIRVNAVSPGMIDTPMHPQQAHGFLAALQPLGRMGHVADIVDAVLYLDDAPFVTGETLHVDGGARTGQW